MYLVLIETSGNQNYIFSTNKLRENVGASELTYRIGTDIVSRFVDEINGLGPQKRIQPVITTSGKSVLLVDGDDSVAREIVRKVTAHAAEFMPGLTVHGAIVEIKGDDANAFHRAIGEVHERLEEIRFQIPSNLQRFQRLPFVAACATSNYPAADVRKLAKDEVRKFSAVASAKRDALNERPNDSERPIEKSRVIDELEEKFGVVLPKNLEELEKAFPETKWLAVVHADGNGLGQIFLKFDEFADMSSFESYRKDYSDFSDEIDRCTRSAFGGALQSLQGKIGSVEIPVVPLILGGDDLTFLIDGEHAIQFTAEFMATFERACSENKIITRLTKSKDGVITPLGVCAGIAIIKPHYPFHQAYQLAAELLSSAKMSKKISTGLSAFDFQVLYDSSGTDLDTIRGKTPFVARPYVVTEEKLAEKLAENPLDPGISATDAKSWVKRHAYANLVNRLKLMVKPSKDDDTKRAIPNSQLHTLREALFFGTTTAEIKDAVDSRAALIAHRYSDFKDLSVSGSDSLFFEAVPFDRFGDEPKTYRTYLLDALDLTGFWNKLEAK